MHFRVHPPEHVLGQAGRWQSPYHDTMVDHDKVVGALLDKLDDRSEADGVNRSVVVRAALRAYLLGVDVSELRGNN